MDFELKTEYWDDPAARQAFKEFIRGIHGLDFTEWESSGFWDDAYTPFSYFRGDRVVASVCLYLLDAVIDGEAAKLLQISGVGTSPEYRRRGLSRQLTDIGLDWASGRHEGIFLFSDEDAVSFYTTCGFKPIEEYVERMEVSPVLNRGNANRLDPGWNEDLETIHGYAMKRSPISNRFSVMNDKLFMFHVLYGLRRDIIEIPDLDCLVLFRREKGCLSLFDIVGERIPAFADLYPYIADEGDAIVEFHFFTDRLGLDGTRIRPLHGNNPFVRGDFPVAKPVFPYTSRA